VIVPLAYLLFKLPEASAVKDFSRLSDLSKLVMLAGIVSMIFFRIYF
jgi:4-hydroxybenzoate polyprenyltransferase